MSCGFERASGVCSFEMSPKVRLMIRSVAIRIIRAGMLGFEFLLLTFTNVIRNNLSNAWDSNNRCDERDPT